MKRSTLYILLGIAAVALSIFLLRSILRDPSTSIIGFDGQRAYQDAAKQMELGPRTPGSLAHQAALDYFKQELTQAGWDFQIQDTIYGGQRVQNGIAKRGSGPRIILGAHYDSRMIADQDADPSKQSEPVPGANDGASGTAILLELARSLPKNLRQEIWLVFIDSEDQGDLPGWDWILGSSAFAQSLDPAQFPEAVVIVDMVGDANLNIKMERNSDSELTRQIWDTASKLGYAKYFIPEPGFSMIDDHTPFLERGIPAVDIIDFNYPYWHTTEDTLDKISPVSLDMVGNTLYRWLTNR